MIAKRDELAALPIVRAGWVDIETDRIYSQVWPGATSEERRTLLTDAGFVVKIGRHRRVNLEVDVSRTLGTGPESVYQKLLTTMSDSGIQGLAGAPDGSITVT